MNYLIVFLISLVLSDTVDLRCGTSWEDAISRCGTECVSETDAECDQGEICYNIGDESEVLCTYAPTMSPTPAPTNKPPELDEIYKEWWLWVAIGIIILVIIAIIKLVSGEYGVSNDINENDNLV